MQIRNRVRELRLVRASELLPNRKNWRRHPAKQAAALHGLLGEIGYADALIARETADGLVLIDGHLRAETTPNMMVPVVIVDLTEDEADKFLLTADPLAGMAVADVKQVDALLATGSRVNRLEPCWRRSPARQHSRLSIPILGSMHRSLRSTKPRSCSVNGKPGPCRCRFRPLPIGVHDRVSPWLAP